MSDKPGAFPDTPTYDNAIQELESQAHYLRTYTFPSLVAKRQMTRSLADFKLRSITFAIETMRALRDDKPLPTARTP